MQFCFYLQVSGQRVKTSFQTQAEKLETGRIVKEKPLLNYLAFITSPRSIKMSLILLLLDKTYVCSDKNLPTHKVEQSPQRFILYIYKCWLILIWVLFLQTQVKKLVQNSRPFLLHFFVCQSNQTSRLCIIEYFRYLCYFFLFSDQMMTEWLILFILILCLFC